MGFAEIEFLALVLISLLGISIWIFCIVYGLWQAFKPNPLKQHLDEMQYTIDAAKTTLGFMMLPYLEETLNELEWFLLSMEEES